MRLAKLKDLTTKIGSGATPRGGESVYVPEGVSLIRSQNVLDSAMRWEGLARISQAAAQQLDGVSVQVGDVLLNITGESVARCALVERRFLPARVNQHVMIIRANEELEPGYLQSYLVSPIVKSDLLGLSTGGTRRALTKQQIENLVIPIPPRTEQRAIAEVLGALDDKIAANDRVTLSSERLMVELLSLATGTVPLEELARRSRVSVSPASLGDVLVRHFSLPAFDASSLPVVESAAGILSGKFVVSEPTVLMSKLNPRFPRVWNVPGVEGISLASTEFMVLQPKGVSTSVLWAVLSQPELGQSLVDKASGTSGSHQRVRPQEILSAGVLDPRTLPVSTLQLVTDLGLGVHAARRESAALARLRDALLRELMSGRMRVKDAERNIEEVL